MIPVFPAFKKLTLDDKVDIDARTDQFPLSSDFEFGSLWSWNVKEALLVSLLHDNLVVQFTDYTTGEPILSFLGSNKINETALTLLTQVPPGIGERRLRLMVETAVQDLDRSRFAVEESRDDFDYICDIRQHITFSGRGLKSHRKLLKTFQEQYPDHQCVPLDMCLDETRKEIKGLYERWEREKRELSPNERTAYERFAGAASSFTYTALGIKIDGSLVAFHITSLPPGSCANALFGKADTRYRGVYAALDHFVAQDLLKRGYTYMNIQADLGIQTLRIAKMSLHPAVLLKKYSVTLI